MKKAIRYNPYATKKAFAETDQEIAEGALHGALTDYCATSAKPVVIMFDEVDCLSGGTLISFLRQLRQGYVERSHIPFIHELALAGMRNIRDYKAHVAGRGRIDLCVEVGDHRYPIELKIRYDGHAKEQGIHQLTGYMDTLGLHEGWLVLFERDPRIPWNLNWEQISHKNKKVQIIGC